LSYSPAALLPPPLQRTTGSRTPDSVLSAICLSSTARAWHRPLLVVTAARGVTPLSVTTATGANLPAHRRPAPPALLPVGHSPGQPHYCDCRWSLTPPLSPITHRLIADGLWLMAFAHQFAIGPLQSARSWSVRCCSCRHRLVTKPAPSLAVS